MWSLPVALCLIATCAGAPSEDAPDNRGTEFIVGFMEGISTGDEPVLYFTTASVNDVTVRVTTPRYIFRKEMLIDETFNITIGETRFLELSDKVNNRAVDLDTKGILIEATEEISVYGETMRKYSNDGFMALPTSALGMEYMAASYYPSRSKTQFMVVATEDDTSVQFTMPYNDDVEIYYGRGKYSYGDTFSEQMNRLDTLHIQARRGDVSGTFIKADKPIAVYSGNEESYVLPGKTYDFLVEQLPPMSSWGKTFAFVSTPERTDGDVYKFVAHDNDTEVEIACTGGFTSSFVLDETQTETVDTLTDGMCYAEASKAVLLVQFIKSAKDFKRDNTDPSMVVIYPTEQFTSSYSFTTAVTSDPKIVYQPFITVVANEEEVDGLLLDGEPLVDYVDFLAIPNSNLAGTSINVTRGPHMLQHENPLSNFGGYIYGSGEKASSAFPLGSLLSPINDVCTPSQSELGDGIDNDCDGLIDEEFCDPYTAGEDDDGDGEIDEDCVRIDGTWSEWEAWGDCSATCSNGYKIRERFCDAESPQGVGMYCWGDHEEIDVCETGIDCPSAPDNRGREFILGFMENRRSKTEVELFITTSRVYDVEVRVTSPKHFDRRGDMMVDETFTVTSGYIHNLELDPDMAAEGTEFASKGIYIEADDEIIVYGTNLEKGSNDGFLGLPVDVLGQEYYSVVYSPSSDDNEILIVATEDDTEVRIELPDDDDIKVDVRRDVVRGANDRRKRAVAKRTSRSDSGSDDNDSKNSGSKSGSDKSGSKSGSGKSGSKSGSDKSGSKSGSGKSVSNVSKAQSLKAIVATAAPQVSKVKSAKSVSGSGKSGSKSGSDKSGSKSGSGKSGSKSGSGKSGSKVSNANSVKGVSATSAPKVSGIKSVKSVSGSGKTGSKSGSDKSGSKSGSGKSGSKDLNANSVKSVSGTSAPKISGVKSVNSNSGSVKSGSKSGSGKSGSNSGSKVNSVKSVSATSASKISGVKSVKSNSGSVKSGSNSGSGRSGSKSGSGKSASKVSNANSVKSVSATSAPKISGVKSVRSNSVSGNSGSKSGSGKSGSNSGSGKSGSKSGSGKSGSKASNSNSVKSVSATSAPKISGVNSVKSVSGSVKSGSNSGSGKSGSKSGSGKSGSKSGSGKSGSKASNSNSVKSVSATSAPKISGVNSVKSVSGSVKSGSNSGSGKSGSKSGSDKSGSKSGSGNSGSMVSNANSVKSVSATSAPKISGVKSVESNSGSVKSGSNSGSGKSGSKSGSGKSGSQSGSGKSGSQSGSGKSGSQSGSGKSRSISGSMESGSNSGNVNYDEESESFDFESVSMDIALNVAKGDYSAQDSIQLRMDKFDTFQAQTRKGDLTGARITSNKPIAVFSGNVRAYVLPKRTWDHLVEQLLPVKSWGKEFAIVPTPERTKTGDTIRIVGGAENTTVDVYCSRFTDTAITQSENFVLGPGEFKQFDIESEGNCMVYATEGIMVAMFVKSEVTRNEPTDPSMILIPPIGQYGAAYSFTTPKNSRKNRDYQSYFTFVVKRSEKDGLLLDGEPFPDDTVYLPVPESDDLVGGYVKISEGAHSVVHSSPIVTFGAILYGACSKESYGMPLGLRLADINVPCVPSTMDVADGIDNDCDQRIDEELCGNGIDDDGDGIEDEDCAPAPEVNGNWSIWQEWSDCSEECGDSSVVGERTRLRECDNPAPTPNGLRCPGDKTETEDCYPTTPCHVDGNWGQWEEWSVCSVSCANGTRQRYRNCDDPEPYGDGEECPGDDTEIESCDTQVVCPIHGGYSDWAEWSSCPVTCGIGFQSRERLCDDPMPRFGGRNCSGSTTDSQQCDAGLCPVDGQFSTWSRWTACTVSCGSGGTRDRTRACDNPPPMNGGNDCGPDRQQSEACNEFDCPIDGGYSDWSVWSSCPVTCGIGFQSRERVCDNPVPRFGGSNCSDSSTDSKQCDAGLCPVDGQFSTWSRWTACTVSCGSGGTRDRTRACDNPPPMNGGNDCGPDRQQSEACNEFECPIDGGYSDWSVWTSCPVTCGIGFQSRERLCDNPVPMFGGSNCSDSSTDSKQCDAGLCPVDGQFSTWSRWTACTVSCGSGGTRDRTRACDNPPPMNGGNDCGPDRQQSEACNEFECPIDGGYSDWSVWTSCPVTCGIGFQSRERLCDNPVPMFGGSNCSDSSTDSKQCDAGLCPVDGQFSTWSRWTACTVSCGSGGTRDRTRACDNPPPMNGGNDCGPDRQQSEACNEFECPIDGGYSDWSVWSSCPVTCGIGFQSRERLCDNPMPRFGGSNCSDSSTDSKQCDAGLCPVDGQFSTWSRWTACTVSCGSGGTRDRTRTCDNPPPMNGGNDCGPDRQQSEACNEFDCPIDGGYSDWTQWSACSATCGTGILLRERLCDNPAPQYGGADCVGDATESQSCDSGVICIVDGGFSAWSTWTACSVTCGTGTQDRSRSCNNPAPLNGGLDCSGDTDETMACDAGLCPVDGGYSDWTQWSACSVTCGTGVSFRERPCDNPAPQNGGASCVGDDNESQSCDSGTACLSPVDGGFTAWSTWTACSVTCGTGTQDRSRSCNNPAPQNGGLDCNGDTDETNSCDMGACPVDGGFSAWSTWTACSVTCGTGTQDRSRSCNNPTPQNGGSDCSGDTDETMACDAGSCPVDGGYSDWTQWSACSVTCGTGVSFRERSCDNPAPQNGGASCVGDDNESQSCDSGTTCLGPVDGGFTGWSTWTACSVTCGTGTQGRSRSCINPAPQNGGLDCSGDTDETTSCDAGSCPVDGGYSDWTQWSACSVTCGTGLSFRERSCDNPAPQNGGASCDGDDNESQSCDSGTVCLGPVDGGFSAWSTWTACSVTCGTGTQDRSRSCNNPAPQNGGSDCSGDTDETTSCDAGSCPAPPVNGRYSSWSTWSGCSVTCGTGTSTRSRSCDNPAPHNGGSNCVGSSSESTSCDAGSCSSVADVDGNWGAWAEWIPCTKTCGGGITMRTRECNDPQPSGNGQFCEGVSFESGPCNTETCPSPYGAVAGNYVSRCPTGFFSCKSGSISCIQEVFRCDCMPDCDDGSDESETWAGCTADVIQMCENSATSIGAWKGVFFLLLAVHVLAWLFKN